jgi:hypothetical protein
VKPSTAFVVLVSAWVFAVILIVVFVKAATDEPLVMIEVPRAYLHTYKRGDIVTNARGETFRVKRIQAPNKVLARRET